MAAGVPVVSTRLSGIPELVEDGVSGLLTEPGDPVGLAAALARLLRRDAHALELAQRLALAGRRRVAELHDLAVTSECLAKVLTEGRS
jgi:glycosyltransferase involved in cell wall biosynthesis